MFLLRSLTTLSVTLSMLGPAAWLGFASCIVMACVNSPYPVHAQTISSTEYEVKSAFLLNFAQFVNWPEGGNRTGPVVFGILGDDPFGSSLDTIFEGRTIHERPIEVRRIKRGGSVSGIDVLFIASSEAESVGSVLTTLRKSPTLTVSDIDRFAQQGGMIGFVLKDGRVRFQINPSAAEEAGLLFSAKLLKLADRP